MTAAVAVQPPGQMHLFPPPPDRARPPWRARSGPTVVGPIANLTMAAAVVAQLAAEDGEAWLIAGDGSSCHVTAAGDVTPGSGWPSAVARAISRIRVHSEKGNAR